MSPINWRNYPAATRAALAALAQGTCYWPECNVRILVFVGKDPEINVEIAHIRAANANGPRFVAGLTHQQLNAFANLMLLCVPHHKAVDKNPGKFTIATLEQWKAKREMSGRDALAVVSLTPSQLEDALAKSFGTLKDEIVESLREFERTNAESAAMVRLLVNRISQQRDYVVSQDTAMLLTEAAHQLGHLQDTASLLYEASIKLSSLPDVASQLQNAADQIRSSASRYM